MNKNKLISILSCIFAAALISGCVAGKPIIIEPYEDIAASVKMEACAVKPILEIGKNRISATGTAVKNEMQKLSSVDVSLDSILGNGDALEKTVYDGLGSLEAAALKEAIENACRQHKCQYLLAPRYKIRVEKSFWTTKATCTVTGFPANVKAVVPVNKEDAVIK